MILPPVRDLRLVRIRRGGTLTDEDHRLLALWAADCAEHVLGLFETVRPEDPRPRRAIEHARAWTRGEVPMMQARAVGQSLSYRVPAHVVHDQSITIWSQVGPRNHMYRDLAVDLQTNAGVVDGCITAGRSIEGGTR